MSSDEDNVSVISDMYPSTNNHLSCELDGNTCDSYSHTNSQDASINHSAQMDEMKINLCNNKLQQDINYGKTIDKENINARNQENYSEENLATKDCKNTLVRNITFGNTNDSKSCIIVSHLDRQKTSTISAHSM